MDSEVRLDCIFAAGFGRDYVIFIRKFSMFITASPPPTPPSSLPFCPRKQSAQTELLPLRVIMAANRWGLGRESLGDAGRESQHAVKSRIQPKIEIRWKIIIRGAPILDWIRLLRSCNISRPVSSNDSRPNPQRFSTNITRRGRSSV